VDASDITAFRRKYGLTQQELGDATGLNRGYISAVEQGRREVTCHLREPVASFMKFVEDCERNGRL
jgi:transcriptional regulator with XRE-family HTH domain